MKEQQLTDKEVRELLFQRAKEAGSFAALARELGIGEYVVYATATGLRAPAKTILQALGLRRISIYERDDSATTANDGPIAA